MVSSPIGGFMPIPLAMMIPFMATQSMIMGVAFGEAYQYGKRKISAMTNEEFNAFTMENMAQEVFTDYKQIIPKLKESIQDSTELQKHIVNEMLKLPFELIAGIGEQVSENVSTDPYSQDKLDKLGISREEQEIIRRNAEKNIQRAPANQRPDRTTSNKKSSNNRTAELIKLNSLQRDVDILQFNYGINQNKGTLNQLRKAIAIRGSFMKKFVTNHGQPKVTHTTRVANSRDPKKRRISETKWK